MLAKKDIYNKKQKLHYPTLYNTPEPSILEFFIPLEDRISIFFTNTYKRSYFFIRVMVY